MSNRNKTKSRMLASITLIVVLSLMLAFTTYALILSMTSVDENIFEMGTVKIELNDGKRIFDGSDMNIEPGYSVKKDFTVENKGTADAYYRLYFENLFGSLQEVLTFEIYDGKKLLFVGKAGALNKDKPCVDPQVLKAGEKRTLTVVAKMPENAGNVYKNGGITFDITADAVQAKNNSDKTF